MTFNSTSFFVVNKKENPREGGRGRGGDVARVSDFFQENPILNFFSFSIYMGVVKVREDWLV